jgi:hypothetical protein
MHIGIIGYNSQGMHEVEVGHREICRNVIDRKLC